MLAQNFHRLNWLKSAQSIAQFPQHLRHFSVDPTSLRNYRKVIGLIKILKKYRLRSDSFRDKHQHSFKVTRTDKEPEHYLKNLQLDPGCPRFILSPGESHLDKLKDRVKDFVKNRRFSSFDETKEEFLNNGEVVFFEVLRALVENDFSNLAEFTLGGMKTLQVHRTASYRLTELQRELLRLSSEDLAGDNGYVMKWPFKMNRLGPYIHEYGYTPMDANYEMHLVDNETKKGKLFFRYKVVMCAIYKYEVLLKDIEKNSMLWKDVQVKVPKNYGFDSPRFIFVELDICQEVIGLPFQTNNLSAERKLHDFHVFVY